MPDAELNRAQLAAVKTLSGPLLVLAGAGTGKTRVITFRIAELIRSGITPSRILGVTFTNKAAREMKDRALALLGKRRRDVKPPEICTFHSLCVRILRRHVKLLGYPAEFVIYDRSDQESVARAALRDIRVGHEKLRPGDLITLIGGWKNLGLGPEGAEGVAATDREQLAAMAYARYQATLKASGAVDFDDLLLLTQRVFDEFPAARFAEASRYDHLLIDEYQDTNGLQYGIVKCLAERHGNLCVVGDDDQSIYGWRGAEVAHILAFAKDWPNATVVKLEENYRSRQPVLELANQLIVHNRARHDKRLCAVREGGSSPRFVRYEDETKEAEGVVRDVRERLETTEGPAVAPSDIAILFRTNEQPRAFETELRRCRVPYVLVGGMSFYDRKEVRDLLAYLRVLANPKDEVSLLRIINTPARGIGTGTIDVLLETAVAAGEPLWQVLPQAVEDGRVPHQIGQRIDDFRRLIEGYRGRLGNESLAQLVSELIARIEYKSELERVYKDPADVASRWETLEELINAIAQYEQRTPNASLLGFLEETTLSGRDDDRDDPDKRREHAITLMTLHSAKGLEFPHVYLVGMEEGLLPHRRTLADAAANVDEERRLCYVGVTRARETLTLSFCKSRMKWGKPRPCIPSRFLMEMRGDTERALRAAQAARELFAREHGQRGDDGEEAPSTNEPPREARSPSRARGKDRERRASAGASRRKRSAGS